MAHQVAAEKVALDVARARRDTSGCARVAHLNNAGAALPPDIVVETVVRHLRDEAMSGGYEAAQAAAPRIAQVYASVARLIGAGADEIALTESATRAWDMAFYGFPFSSGDVVLTGESEYSSNVLAFLQVLRRRGADFEVLPSAADGAIDLDRLERRLDELGPRAALVALTHIPTSNGTVQPAAEVGRLARRAGVPYLLDACQSVGQLPVDVGEIGCDLLSATGRKFLRAPRGTGFLYVSSRIRDRLEPPLLDLHSARWVAEDRYELRPDARRFEAWESSVAGRLGLGAAVDYALGWDATAVADRITTLAALLRERLTELPGVRVHDRGDRLSGIVTFSMVGVPAQEIVAGLRRGGVNTSVSWSDSARLDLARRGLDDVVRASVHYYNDVDEIDRLISLVQRMTGVRSPSAGQGADMDDKPTQDDHMHDSGHAPGAVPHDDATGDEDTTPHGGNAAQAAAVFGVHAEPPAEMDSGGAG